VLRAISLTLSQYKLERYFNRKDAVVLHHYKHFCWFREISQLLR